MLKFCKFLIQPLIDTYLVVIQTINLLIEVGKPAIEQAVLVNDLHLVIQDLFNRGAVRFQSSCLFEHIATAFGRFSELKACHRQVYDSVIGSGSKVYIECLRSNRDKAEEFLEIMTDLATAGSVNREKT